MRKFLACAALFLSTSAIADVGLKYFYSTDNEHSSTVRYTVTGWTDSIFGVAATRGLHKAGGIRRYSTSVEGAVRYYGDRFTADGTLGIGEVSSNQYFSGDLGMTYRIIDPLLINVAVFGDLVDSPTGLAQGISYAGVSVGPEYQGNGWGALQNSRMLVFSDGNRQIGGNAKIYKDIGAGAHVYFGTKAQTNDRTVREYWSPEFYARAMFGVGIRHRVAGWLLTGSADVGPDYADMTQDGIIRGENRVSSSYRVTAVKGHGPWTTRITAGAENADSTAYRYRYFSASVILRF